MITRQMAAQKNKSATTGIPRLFFTLTGNVNKSFINVDKVRCCCCRNYMRMYLLRSISQDSSSSSAHRKIVLASDFE